MNEVIKNSLRKVAEIAAVGALAFGGSDAWAQDLERFDPDEANEQSSDAAIDADLVDPSLGTTIDQIPIPFTAQDAEVEVNWPQPGDVRVGSSELTDEVIISSAPMEADQSGEIPIGSEEASIPVWTDPTMDSGVAARATPTDAAVAEVAQASTPTYAEDDLIGAAEGVFGKGAEGLAKMIEDLLEKQGQPNGYIVGREAGGAFVFGARYGSGTLHHKVEGNQKVYWTGPSIGFDAGANAANTFVLVYNLYDSEDLFSRYPAGEGQAYLVGGLHASYLRKGDIVLIPIRMGAGVRLGVNAGYMRFSKKQRWLPF